MDDPRTPGQRLQESFRREKEALGEEVVFGEHPEKLSEIIMDLAVPLVSDLEDFEEVKQALEFTIIAWNLSLLEGPARLAEIRKVTHEAVAGVPDADEEAAAAMLESMVEKKRALYPDNRRIIADYRIDRWRGRVHLSVLSTPFDLPETVPGPTEVDFE